MSMRKHSSGFNTTCLLFFCLSTFCLPQHVLLSQESPEVYLIPKAQNADLKPGKVYLNFKDFLYRFEPEENSSIQAELPRLKRAIARLAEKWYMEMEEAGNAIFVFQENNELPEEGYVLDIDVRQIKVQAKTYAGFFYALQSLYAMAEYDNPMAPITLNTGRVEDYPRYEYRGQHLDVCRHFFSTDEVKKFIDLMARFKFNKFHWHLTDDQGWRIEIKQFPKLQEVASKRNKTLIGHAGEGSQRFDNEEYGGYYTREEILEIIDYAADRAIEVIPEIELPGHARAAIAAYPELSCRGVKLEVPGTWGVFDDIYCSGTMSRRFLKDVLTEVAALFPSRYIHIGGDEAPVSRWKECDKCQAMLDAKSLADEHALMTDFVNEMISFLAEKGKVAIGWDEIMNEELHDSAHVMSWRGTSGGIAGVREGHKVIMTPNSHCYMDHYQSKSVEEPLAIGGLTTIYDLYNYKLGPEDLNAEESKLILGAQCNHWTEYIADFDHLIYMAYPRNLAMAEVLWTGESRGEFKNFYPRLSRQVEFLQLEGYNPANRFVELKSQVSKSDNSLLLEIEKQIDCCGEIYYGEVLPEKEIVWRQYKAAIEIDSSSVIAAKVMDRKRESSGVFHFTVNGNSKK